MIYLKETKTATKQEKQVDQDGNDIWVEVDAPEKYVYVFAEDFTIKDKFDNDVTMTKNVYVGTMHKIMMDLQEAQTKLDAINFKLSLIPNQTTEMRTCENCKNS